DDLGRARERVGQGHAGSHPTRATHGSGSVQADAVARRLARIGRGERYQADQALCRDRAATGAEGAPMIDLKTLSDWERMHCADVLARAHDRPAVLGDRLDPDGMDEYDLMLVR